MKEILHIDIETYSSVDIKNCGSYKYFESIDFEILILCYAINNEPVVTIDIASGENIPQSFIDMLTDPHVEKWAHNANFERNAFKTIGYDIPPEQWFCTAVLAANAGLPLALADVSKELELNELGKQTTGKALIREFSVPVKPTIRNGGRRRNFPHHAPEKWEQYKEYCRYDVIAEREIHRRLHHVEISESERRLYALDQAINDRGVMVDIPFIKRCLKIDALNAEDITLELTKITKLQNPNSPAQLKKWLSERSDKDFDSLAKQAVSDLLKELPPGEVSDALRLRQKGSKTSIKKYDKMIASACDDGRVRGLFQFCGAYRTGRWAGRLVQLQNLPRNEIKDLDGARNAIASDSYSDIKSKFEDIADTISQLIRTALIAPPGKTFAVADFSAIEARVLAWLAGEQWRLDVFDTHGKIYEASAAAMFNVPLESIDKGSPLRQRGKVAELALGYQGGVNALKAMGADRMGLTEDEMSEIVAKWRKANPAISKLWRYVDLAAVQAVETGETITLRQFQNLKFSYKNGNLYITLPSGRRLTYFKARLAQGKFSKIIKYRGTATMGNAIVWSDTYGGKLVENIVQAISRDLLAVSLLALHDAGYYIVMHVHDETVAEIPKTGAEDNLEKMCEIMGASVEWAPGLPLRADGYITEYYKKD